MYQRLQGWFKWDELDLSSRDVLGARILTQQYDYITDKLSS